MFLGTSAQIISYYLIFHLIFNYIFVSYINSTQDKVTCCFNINVLSLLTLTVIKATKNRSTMTGSEWEPITWRRRLRVRRITHFTQQCWVRQDVLLSGGLHGSSALLCRYWYCSSSVLRVCVLQVLTFVTCLFSSSLGGPTDPRGPGAEGRVGSHALQSKQTRFPRSHGLVPAAVRISADHGRPDRALQFACFCLHWGEGQVLSPQEVTLERILHREPRGAERRRGLSVCGLLPQWCRSAPPLHKNNNQSHHTRRLSRIPRCTCVPQNSESVRF